MKLSDRHKIQFRKDWEESLIDLLNSLELTEETKNKVLQNKAKVLKFLLATENLSFFGITLDNEED